MQSKILFYTLFILLTSTLYAQAQDNVWAKAVSELEKPKVSLKANTKEATPKVAPLQFAVSTASFQAKEKKLQQIDDAMNTLKLDLEQNFVIIEDLLSERFTEVGLTYKFYTEQYPEEDYTLSQWVTDQENKLLEMRKLEALASFIEE